MSDHTRLVEQAREFESGAWVADAEALAHAHTVAIGLADAVEQLEAERGEWKGNAEAASGNWMHMDRLYNVARARVADLEAGLRDLYANVEIYLRRWGASGLRRGPDRRGAVVSDAIGRLRQAGNNATGGEWLSHSGIVYQHDDGCDGFSHDAHGHPCRVADTWHKDDTNRQRGQGIQDARFIATARNVWDALLDVALLAQRHHEHVNGGWEAGMAEHGSDPEWWDGWEAEREELLNLLGAALDRLDEVAP